MNNPTLASNILDAPDFFWDAEPTLHPLYVAIRDYLEIDPRIKVLNERCRVFLDLSEILSDSIADSKMSLITWIVIVLIVVSIVVTSAEIVLRTALIRKGNEAGGGASVDVFGGEMGGRVVEGVSEGVPEGVGIEDLRRWMALLGENS